MRGSLRRILVLYCAFMMRCDVEISHHIAICNCAKKKKETDLKSFRLKRT